MPGSHKWRNRFCSVCSVLSAAAVYGQRIAHHVRTACGPPRGHSRARRRRSLRNPTRPRPALGCGPKARRPDSWSERISRLGSIPGLPYYDCTANFISAVQTIVDGQCDGRIRVAAPFLTWTKRQIWDYSVNQQVPIELTYSCEKGQVQACGSCLSCRDREELLACQKLHTST